MDGETVGLDDTFSNGAAYPSRMALIEQTYSASHELYCTACNSAYNPLEFEDYEPPQDVKFL